MIGRRGKRARFVAVLEPVRGFPPAVRAVRVRDDDGVVRVEVLCGGETDRIRLDRRTRFEVERGGKVLLEAGG